MRFRLVETSGNRKTGPISVISSSRDTCPEACPLKGWACYGETHPIRYLWDKVTVEGYGLEDLCQKLNSIMDGSILRYGDVGDLPGDGEYLDEDKCYKLAEAMDKNKFKAFGYTHYCMDKGQNLAVVKGLAEKGLSINISTTNPRDAVRFVKIGLPVVLAVANQTHKSIYQGIKMVPCFATKNVPDAYCITCGRGKPWCWRTDRKFVITFKAHGVRKRKLSNYLIEEAPNDFYQEK